MAAEPDTSSHAAWKPASPAAAGGAPSSPAASQGPDRQTWHLRCPGWEPAPLSPPVSRGCRLDKSVRIHAHAPGFQGPPSISRLLSVTADPRGGWGAGTRAPNPLLVSKQSPRAHPQRLGRYPGFARFFQTLQAPESASLGRGRCSPERSGLSKGVREGWGGWGSMDREFTRWTRAGRPWALSADPTVCGPPTQSLSPPQGQALSGPLLLAQS